MRHLAVSACVAIAALSACVASDGPTPPTGCGASCPSGSPASCASPSPAGASGLAPIATTSPWPNVPSGLATLSDEPFDALTENGWITLQRNTLNGSGASLASDPRAPLSPPGVIQFTYADGFPAGSTPAVTFYDLVTPVKEAYFGFWWKPSNPWQNNLQSGVNKLAFELTAQTGVDGEIVVIMFGTGGPYTVQVVTEFPGDVRRLSPNQVATPVTLGAWHRVEWYTKFSSTDTTADGVTRWWLDGVPQGSYANLIMPADPGFEEFQLAPTWGGVIGTKSESDFYCYDHAHISIPMTMGATATP